MDAHHPQERGESSGAQDDEGGVHRAAAGGSGGHGHRQPRRRRAVPFRQEMVAPEVHNIGDSYNTQKPGNMWQATKAAYNLAIKI